jgi:ribonuclease D
LGTIFLYGGFMTATLYQGDLPADLSFGTSVAIDTETMGLNPVRDRLCVVQLSSGDGNAHVVQLKADQYGAPNLKKLLTDPKVTKIFHFGRFDIATIWMHLNVLTAPVYCTKLASRLARTFTSQHSLKTLCSELLNVELDKQQQTTDWGAGTLTPEQLKYAAADVLHLHKIRGKLDEILVREGRDKLAQACFDFLPTRSLLDAAGWNDEDIFAH